MTPMLNIGVDAAFAATTPVQNQASLRECYAGAKGGIHRRLTLHVSALDPVPHASLFEC
eukprot:CAMPEP_0179119256 /NCGR_PEP_ID=MMETSP0796-20121207/56131_1 /TAXON_ID=73915 /ORGANISM="Pyrodinium bahamense, Strain pbaha01" /LENGTH=58 /DNA_ID=CAMNT_0020817751 /DNA_START=14 /DNA_END=190 /DNA_ORIENTATION=+